MHEYRQHADNREEEAGGHDEPHTRETGALGCPSQRDLDRQYDYDRKRLTDPVPHSFSFRQDKRQS